MKGCFCLKVFFYLYRDCISSLLRSHIQRFYFYFLYNRLDVRTSLFLQLLVLVDEVLQKVLVVESTLLPYLLLLLHLLYYIISLMNIMFNFFVFTYLRSHPIPLLLLLLVDVVHQLFPLLLGAEQVY